MREGRNPLDPPEALAWRYGQADAAGVDLQGGFLAETAHCAVAHLERQVEAGFLPTPEALQFASLLVRLAGNWWPAQPRSIPSLNAPASALALGGALSSMKLA